MNQEITPGLIRVGGAVFVAVFLAGITLYQARFYISGPKIIIAQHNIQSDKFWADVSFKVRNTNTLTISGRSVVPQLSGLVTERIFLQKGKNIIEFVAQDSYGSTEIDYLYITYPQ